jgi:hypothetical protein
MFGLNVFRVWAGQRVTGPRVRKISGGALVVAAVLVLAAAVQAQTAALLRGQVVDPQGGALGGAAVRITNPLTGLQRDTKTSSDGRFQLTNLPLDTYEVQVEAPGFTAVVRTVPLLSSVPVDLTVLLEVAGQATTVTVTPEQPLVDTVSAGTRNRVSMERIAQMPAAVGSRGIESVLVSFPGFAQNANGAIHPRGAHNQMTFVIDGLAISDQLTGAFANALDAGIVQAAELITGNVPAEFGSKVSGVAVITSRSGLGIGRPLMGDVTLSAAGFDTWHGAVGAGGDRGRVGYFGSATGMRTDRFLDQVTLENLHNAGHFGRAFFRLDLMVNDRSLLRMHGMGGRSAFEIANLRSQQMAGQDQRQALADGAGWVSYLRTLDLRSTLELTAGMRRTTAQLLPSAGDTPVTAAQERSLANLTTAARYTRQIGAQTVRAGVDVQHFPVREHFTMGITSAAFNDPASADVNPSLYPHDLTRGGAPFVFDAERAGRQMSAFAQTTLRWRTVTLAAGMRHDHYVFIVRGHQLQPRVGVSYQLPNALGTLRASYNRNYQTPPNENLLLSSSEAASRLAPESVSSALGGGFRPIQPERQVVYEAGYQRALGRVAALDVAIYRKDSRDQQDNNNFFDTGIIFPTALAAIRADGAELRLTLPSHAGLSGTLSATAARAISTPPFTGGLFLGQDAVTLLSSGPFRIDHDQRLSLHGTAQYAHASGAWVGASVRYDSGLVSNPSDPDQVRADPDFNDLLPYVDLRAAVPRVRPRTIADAVVGYDLRSGGRKTWSVQTQITNLTNRTALYNFQSVFVGTRIVQPRTAAVRVTRHF